MQKIIEIILVGKDGSLSSLLINNFKEEKLYKLCGFKSSMNFEKQGTWKVDFHGIKYNIHVYGRREGRWDMKNHYKFPPPFSRFQLFGTSAIVAREIKENGKEDVVSITMDTWKTLYERFFTFHTEFQSFFDIDH